MNTYTVIYRTGGTSNAKWRRVAERYTELEAAEQMAASLSNGGHRAMAYDTDMLELLGMPGEHDALEGGAA